MNKRLNPSEIAREAIKRLAELQLPPTPANYQMCYNEIARLPNAAGFPEGNLRQVARVLKATNPEQQQHLDQFDRAIGRHSWQEMIDALAAFSKAAAPARIESREPPHQAAAEAANGLRQALLGSLAQTIECIKPALETDDGRVVALVDALLLTLRDPAADLATIQSDLAVFNQRLKFIAEEQVEIRHSLLKLLQLVVDNVAKLVLDDAWLDGQLEALAEAVKLPLGLRRLDDAGRRLTDVIERQAQVKDRYVKAQEEMRELLAGFVTWLSSMNSSSTLYQDRLESGAKRLEQVRGIDEFAPLLQDVIAATRAMAEDTARARGELGVLQEKQSSAAAELAGLRGELERASALARHDPLTQVLNRKGLDEVMTKEVAMTRRKDMPLALGVLDIDNFKQLNDRLGHKAGDAALLHLVSVTRENLRPSDSLARYGGEEFVILMPDTSQEEGCQVLVRLQRELTKRFFLANSEKVLITFSAGVVMLGPEELAESAIERADQAMYLAKRAGKNRVIGA